MGDRASDRPDNAGRHRLRRRRFLVTLGLVGAIVAPGCSSLLDGTPTPTPDPGAGPIRTPSPAPPTPQPTATPWRPPEITTLVPPSPTQIIPRPVSEKLGVYVTSNHFGGRYYYHRGDQRWKGLPYRVWFGQLGHLLQLFPDRIPAP